MKLVLIQDGWRINTDMIEALKADTDELLIATIGNRYCCIKTEMTPTQKTKIPTLRDMLETYLTGITSWYDLLSPYTLDYAPGGYVKNKYFKSSGKLYRVLITHTSSSLATSLSGGNIEEAVFDDNKFDVVDIFTNILSV